MFEALTTTSTVSLEVQTLLLDMAMAIVCGAFIALTYGWKSHASRSFLVALVALPALVTVVIAAVNGNVGAGVAVAGAFSLVRFRSAPGSGRDIAFVFLAMAVGLVCGMGYVQLAGIVTAIMCVVFLFASVFVRGNDTMMLRVTVPEDLDFIGVFDETLFKYCTAYNFVNVKTAGMGSLYKLTYDVTMKDATNVKSFIDELRTKNGNLEVAFGHKEDEYVL